MRQDLNASTLSTSVAYIRPARPDDALAINALYSGAYKGANNHDARNQYPFPQFLDPDWVARAAVDPDICWLVAETKRKVVGTLGAVRNVGGPDDRVAELFGLVVHDSQRGRGIAKMLMGTLCGRLAEDAAFMIAETRTADPGGWRTSGKSGFLPAGFEPFAHRTPVGFEPMLLLGNLSEKARAQRVATVQASPTVQRFARAVLDGYQLRPPASKRQLGYPLTPRSWERLRPWLAPVKGRPESFVLRSYRGTVCVRLIEDHVFNGPSVNGWGNVGPHASGVVGFDRLEGEDSKGHRFDRKYVVCFAGDHPVAFARTAWDRRDRRVRILRLQTLFHGLEGLLLAHIVRSADEQAAYGPLSIVIDVLANYPALHTTLESLGFFPTVYYPGLVNAASCRMDAVQYTRLQRLRLQDQLHWMLHVRWTPAQRVLKALVHRMDSSVERYTAPMSC